jgi:hypothetical protein
MKKVKMLLEPAEVKMIRDALQLCYDDDCIDDIDNILEGLCQAFDILAMSGNFVKVSVDENAHYDDECVSDDIVSDQDDPLDECHCDACRADRGLPPFNGDCDGDPENDRGDSGIWDASGEAWDAGDDNIDEGFNDSDDECHCDASCDDVWDAEDDDHVGCGVTTQDLEDAWNTNEPWNANEPWNTENK